MKSLESPAKPKVCFSPPLPECYKDQAHEIALETALSQIFP